MGEKINLESRTRTLTAVFDSGDRVEVLNLYSVAVVKDVGGGRSVSNGPLQRGLFEGVSIFGFDVDRHLQGKGRNKSPATNFEHCTCCCCAVELQDVAHPQNSKLVHATSCLPDLRRPVLAICALPRVNLVVAPVQASKGSQRHDSSLGYHAIADSENGEGGGEQKHGAAAAG